MCLIGAVVASWSPTQEVANLSSFNGIFLPLNLLNPVKAFGINFNVVQDPNTPEQLSVRL